MKRNKNAQMIHPTLGFRLRLSRIIQRLTLDDVFDETGLDVENFEYDREIPDLEQLITLARLYNVSADYLLGLTPRRQPYEPIEDSEPQDLPAIIQVKDLLNRSETK